MVKIGRLLGSGKEAEVFEYGVLALKLYRATAPKASPFREASNLAILERLALPIPKVHSVGEFGGRWGLSMDRAPNARFAERFVSMTGSPPLEDMAGLHFRIHGQPGDGLPSLMDRLRARIQQAPGLDAKSRSRLVSGLESLPDGDCVCHGDFHPWNIHGSGEKLVVVDWLDACRGNPLADVCRTYVLLHGAARDQAMAYVEAYAERAKVEVSTILAWVPQIASARLTEGAANEDEELRRLAGLTS